MEITNCFKKDVKLILVFAFFLFFNINLSVANAEESEQFFVDSSYDNRGRSSITATNRVIGLNAQFFVDDYFWDIKNNQEQSALLAGITSLSNEFDNVIYPKMHQLYGTEWNPGIDGNNKIYILLTDIKNDGAKGSYGGYFNTANEYSKSLLDEYKRNQLAELERQKNIDLASGKNIDSYAAKEAEINLLYTNQKEILYLNANFLLNSRIKSFLAHEFQHMINWNQKTRINNIEEEIWLNEALSEYAPSALGYDDGYKGSALESTVNNFIRNSSDSLTEWKNTNQDYSSVNVFMQYLIGRYGVDIIKSIENSPYSGTAAIDKMLRDINLDLSFSKVFSDWTITNYFNGRSIQNIKFAYANPDLNYDNLHVPASSSYLVYSNRAIKNSITSNEEDINEWSGKWYQLISSPILSTANQTLRISLNINNPSAFFEIPYVIENLDGTLNLKKIDLVANSDKNISVNDFGTVVKSVIIMPVNKGNGGNPTKFSFLASIVSLDEPTINTINPNTSELGNKTLVTIKGDNFKDGAIVKFGGIPATEVSVLDPQTIIAKAPPFYNNTEVNVEIVNPNQSAVLAPAAFSYKTAIPLIKNGQLIRAEGDTKVYLIFNGYKRWIRSEKIFNLNNYKWNEIITVTSQIMDSYVTSVLVRADNDYRVYEIGSDGKKHHLSMTAAKFTSSGRKWDSIFVISGAEKNIYKTGAIIAK